MIECFIISSIAVLIKIFIDRENIMYNSLWEYFFFWLGFFFISYSGLICSQFARDILR